MIDHNAKHAVECLVVERVPLAEVQVCIAGLGVDAGPESAPRLLAGARASSRGARATASRGARATASHKVPAVRPTEFLQRVIPSGFEREGSIFRSQRLGAAVGGGIRGA